MIAKFALVASLALPMCGPDAKAPTPIPMGRGKTYLYGEGDPHPKVSPPDQLNLIMTEPGKAAKYRCEHDYGGVYGTTGSLQQTIPVCYAVKREPQ